MPVRSIESFLKTFKDQAVANTLLGQFWSMAKLGKHADERSHLQQQQIEALSARIKKAEHAPPVPKGGPRMTSTQACAYLGIKSRTTFQRFVNADVLRCENPDALKGQTHFYTQAHLDNVRQMIDSGEARRQVFRYENAQKEETDQVPVDTHSATP